MCKFFTSLATKRDKIHLYVVFSSFPFMFLGMWAFEAGFKLNVKHYGTWFSATIFIAAFIFVSIENIHNLLVGRTHIKSTEQNMLFHGVSIKKAYLIAPFPLLIWGGMFYIGCYGFAYSLEWIGGLL